MKSRLRLASRAQYFPSRNSMTKAGTPKVLRIRRSRSLRTTRPGKASVASLSSSSSTRGWSLISASHVPSNGQLDPAGRDLAGFRGARRRGTKYDLHRRSHELIGGQHDFDADAALPRDLRS